MFECLGCFGSKTGSVKKYPAVTAGKFVLRECPRKSFSTNLHRIRYPDFAAKMAD